MNKSELKNNFYKRFGEGKGRIEICESGYPIPLLGSFKHCGVPFIGCSLSMRVLAVARKSQDTLVTVTSTSTDMCRIYDTNKCDGRDKISEFIKKSHNINGAYVLHDSNIVPALRLHIPYISTVIKVLLKVSNVEKLNTAFLSENEKNPFLTSFYSSKGYAVTAVKNEAKTIPLPVTGYKIILCTPDKATSTPDFSELFITAKKIYPHISSFSDIDEDMKEIIGAKLKSDGEKRLLDFTVDECVRIKNGINALNACNMNEFSRLVNDSYSGRKGLLNESDERLFLADELRTSDGVLCTSVCGAGAFAICDENMCDFVLLKIKNAFESEFGYTPSISVNDSM